MSRPGPSKERNSSSSKPQFSRPKPPYVPRPPAGKTSSSKGKERAANASLDCSGNPESIPASLAPNLYPQLHKLDLSNCKLKSLTLVKAAKGSLTWLNVSGNELDGAGAWNGVEELKGLFVLNASNCGLTRVPTVINSLTSLKAIVLSHNKLTNLGSGISHLADLNSLIVSHNSLKALPASLTTLPSLKKISASHNNLSSTSLPSLASLSRLHELRISNNPAITALPAHFGSWGKARDPQSGKDGKGIEILDIGACGFEEWQGLMHLAGQDCIVNLGLKGNAVSDKAIEDEGFEVFRTKMRILLPTLRILNDVRFDAKFRDLKEKRDARGAEERILDAGPMMLAINERSENPVLITQEAMRERELKKRRKLMEGKAKDDGWERRKKALERAKTDGESDAESLGEMEIEPPKSEEKEEGDKVHESKKRKRAVESGAGAEPATDATRAVASDEPAKAKKAKRKNRHESRALAAAIALAASKEDEALPDPEPSRKSASKASSTKASTLNSDEKQKSEREDKPRRKRGRESRYLGTTRTDEERKAAEEKRKEQEKTKPKSRKERRDPAGLLASLKGDEEEQKHAQAKREEASKVKEVEAAEEEPKEKEQGKEKTSVLKVVDLKKGKDKWKGDSAPKVDIVSLFSSGGDGAFGWGDGAGSAWD
ncbi:L domain-like protein [Meredithblackwellia eburnea MCA 4105]